MYIVQLHRLSCKLKHVFDFKLLNAQNEGKNETENDSKKKETSGSGHVVRGANNEVIQFLTEDGVSYKVSGKGIIFAFFFVEKACSGQVKCLH